MAPKSSEAVSFPDRGLELRNQEVWLVQVPSDFEAARATIKSEQEVEYEGKSFALLTNDAQLPDCNVLVSSENDNRLVSTSLKPRGVLTLTKKVSLPKVDYEKVIMPKPLVPQKENLRMRHYPTGYGPESFGIQAGPEPKKRASSSTGDAEPDAKKRKAKEEASSKQDKKHKDKKSKEKSRDKKDKKKDKKKD